MMIIYRVNYNRKNFGAYFSGSYHYFDKVEKFFATRKEAEEFVASAEMEYVPTWKREEIVKEAGKGEIEEIAIG